MTRKPRRSKQASAPQKAFDPNSAGDFEGIFGLPFSAEDSRLHLISVPFEATTSYGRGTALAPKRIFDASQQVDLFHPDFPEAWRKGIYLRPELKSLSRLNKTARQCVEDHRKKASPRKQALVNEISIELNDAIYAESRTAQKAGKLVGLVGGDHSTPFGHIRAQLEAHPEMGILHIDAHFDLRKAYEGFRHSHASIMYNVVTELKPKALVQVGIRDFCDEEWQFARAHPEIAYFLDSDLFSEKARGESWDSIVKDILQTLPNNVYVSFDIDGLEPSFCPGTGTPVPGGLHYQEAVYLLRSLVRSGRRIVGFDLNEVGTSEWDANVGARILFELSCLSLR